jgi:hypothetical protein
MYQYMNQAFAAMLPPHYTYLNREQDLGDEGLRQAKLTYRPCGFVKKYAAALDADWDAPADIADAVADAAEHG